MSVLLHLLAYAAGGYALGAFDDWTDGRFHRWIWSWFLAWFVFGAVVAMLAGDVPQMVGNGAFAAYVAWDLWRKRPPRKRRPARVAGRVRDLGHRLVVTP